MNYPEKHEQLESLVLFLLSKGIITWAKCAQVMGISLADLHYEYSKKVKPDES